MESRSRLRASRSLSKAFVTTYTTRNPACELFACSVRPALVAFTIAAQTGLLEMIASMGGGSFRARTVHTPVHTPPLENAD